MEHKNVESIVIKKQEKGHWTKALGSVPLFWTQKINTEINISKSCVSIVKKVFKRHLGAKDFGFRPETTKRKNLLVNGNETVRERSITIYIPLCYINLLANFFITVHDFLRYGLCNVWVKDLHTIRNRT